jgi:hypothetical protein
LANVIYKGDAITILGRVLPLAALDPGPVLSMLEKEAFAEQPAQDREPLRDFKRARR